MRKGLIIRNSTQIEPVMNIFKVKSLIERDRTAIIFALWFFIAVMVITYVITGVVAIFVNSVVIILVICSFMFFLLDMIKDIRGRVSFSIVIFILANIAVLIVSFANIFRWTGLHYPTADAPSDPHDLWGALYFSVVTWTTLGYGDVTPYANTRFFAASEALLGYIVMALLISVLSAMAQSGHKND